MGTGWDEFPDAVLEIGRDRVIRSANPAAGRLLGYPPEALAGRGCAELLDPRTPAGSALLDEGWPHPASLRSVNRMPEVDCILRRSDGSGVLTHVAGSYLRDGDGRVEGALFVIRTSSRRAAAAASGIEIVSTVSHELRSPLTSVKGYTSLLLNRWDRIKDDQKKMMLEQVNHDADRVTRLITELLDISRLETGRLVLRRQLVDIPALTSSVVEKVGLDQPGLSPDIEFPDSFPRVYADPDKVEQVLTNLVENACKYASPTGLSILGESTGDEVAVSVADRGEGIPTADLPRVFTKFFRRDLGKPTGSGLGLWISRGLVEAHGGRLTASSRPGRGTTFRFTLPLVELDDLFPD